MGAGSYFRVAPNSQLDTSHPTLNRVEPGEHFRRHQAEPQGALTQAGAIRVTVVVDTYNYGHFIEEAIDSVLAQNFPPEQMEVLVVDDGSADDTADRVRKFGNRIQYFCKANGGQASAFNFGIAKARGEIVAFLDGDDYWLPGKLQGVAAEFEKHPEAGMVYHNFYCKRGASVDTEPDSGLAGLSGFLADNRKSLLGFNLYPTATLAFRRNVLERLLPVPESLIVQADAHLTACVIFVAPIVYIEQPLAVYRVHADNIWNCVANTPQGSNIFEGDPAAKARLQRRVITTRAIREGVREWLEKNGFDVRRPDLQAFLMRWTISSRVAEFALSPPGRLRFFRHQLEQSWYFGSQMTWRHLAVHYANAFGSLLVGYRNFHRLDEWRLAVKRSFHSVLGRS
jgi:glycosyltransferase involved in cell wall biosynthesis